MPRIVGLFISPEMHAKLVAGYWKWLSQHPSCISPILDTPGFEDIKKLYKDWVRDMEVDNPSFSSPKVQEDEIMSFTDDYYFVWIKKLADRQVNNYLVNKCKARMFHSAWERTAEYSTEYAFAAMNDEDISNLPFFWVIPLNNPLPSIIKNDEMYSSMDEIEEELSENISCLAFMFPVFFHESMFDFKNNVGESFYVG